MICFQYSLFLPLSRAFSIDSLAQYNQCRSSCMRIEHCHCNHRSTEWNTFILLNFSKRFLTEFNCSNKFSSSLLPSCNLCQTFVFSTQQTSKSTESSSLISMFSSSLIPELSLLLSEIRLEYLSSLHVAIALMISRQ